MLGGVLTCWTKIVSHQWAASCVYWRVCVEYKYLFSFPVIASEICLGRAFIMCKKKLLNWCPSTLSLIDTWNAVWCTLFRWKRHFLTDCSISKYIWLTAASVYSHLLLANATIALQSGRTRIVLRSNVTQTILVEVSTRQSLNMRLTTCVRFLAFTWMV